MVRRNTPSKPIEKDQNDLSQMQQQNDHVLPNFLADHPEKIMFKQGKETNSFFIKSGTLHSQNELVRKNTITSLDHIVKKEIDNELKQLTKMALQRIDSFKA